MPAADACLEALLAPLACLARPVRRDGEIRVHGLRRFLCHLHGFVIALILVQVGIMSSFGNYFGHYHQRLGVVPIDDENLAGHSFGLVRAVRVLVGAR